MSSQHRGVRSLVVTVAAVVIAACSGGGGTPMESSASSAGGSGGVERATVTSAVTTSAGADVAPDAGPLACKNHTYSSIKAGPCDLLQQDCGPGKTCQELQLVGGTWTTRCVAANGLKGEGETCSSDEECLAKLSCGAGRCVPVCCPQSNQPCMGGTCDLHVQLDSAASAFKQVCHYAQACTLLVPSTCEAGFDCHIEDPVQGLATCVEPSGDRAADLAPCTYLNDCGDMEHCFGTTGLGESTCHYYCRLDQVDPASPGPGLGGCPPGQTCVSELAGTTIDFNLPTIGLCAPPDAGTSAGGGSP